MNYLVTKENGEHKYISTTSLVQGIGYKQNNIIRGINLVSPESTTATKLRVKVNNEIKCFSTICAMGDPETSAYWNGHSFVQIGSEFLNNVTYIDAWGVYIGIINTNYNYYEYTFGYSFDMIHWTTRQFNKPEINYGQYQGPVAISIVTNIVYSYEENRLYFIMREQLERNSYFTIGWIENINDQIVYDTDVLHWIPGSEVQLCKQLKDNNGIKALITGAPPTRIVVIKNKRLTQERTVSEYYVGLVYNHILKKYIIGGQSDVLMSDDFINWEVVKNFTNISGHLYLNNYETTLTNMNLIPDGSIYWYPCTTKMSLDGINAAITLENLMLAGYDPLTGYYFAKRYKHLNKGDFYTTYISVHYFVSKDLINWEENSVIEIVKTTGARLPDFIPFISLTETY